jgi:hypothetical protein
LESSPHCYNSHAKRLLENDKPTVNSYTEVG